MRQVRTQKSKEQKTKMQLSFFLALIVSILLSALGDTPANCTYEDIRGTWLFYEGERSGNSRINCTDFSGPIKHTITLQLLFPNKAVDELGHEGRWTIVYNQGFEVVINYRKYFAFSQYRQEGQNVTSYCDTIKPGWSHDVLGKNWACYNAHKAEDLEPKTYEQGKPLISGKANYKQRKSFVQIINNLQTSWTATTYSELEGLSFEDLVRMSGGTRSKIHSPPSPAPVTVHHKKLADPLPREFDWRDVDGINYVSPVRNQGQCGSCYAFSSLAMLESRLRIATNNTLQVVFSPQDVVSCSEYSQGCDGGFPYLIAGKYAQDFGVVPESCSPYGGSDRPCSTKRSCKRYYVADYEYVGGFYGGCNEELMKLELIQNGPLTVAFEVYPDFAFYKSGVYHHTHTELKGRFNPFHLVNHGVLITGYGFDNVTGENFWSVKNSWGTNWGENGYFRIRRGTNECNIESTAVSAIPIP